MSNILSGGGPDTIFWGARFGPRAIAWRSRIQQMIELFIIWSSYSRLMGSSHQLALRHHNISLVWLQSPKQLFLVLIATTELRMSTLKTASSNSTWNTATDLNTQAGSNRFLKVLFLSSSARLLAPMGWIQNQAADTRTKQLLLKIPQMLHI